MAETFLRPVINKLADLLIDEANSLKGVRKQVKSVRDELEIIEPFLRDAEAKSGKGEVSDASKVWLKQLRDEADRIEDVVDEYTYHLEEKRYHQSGLFRSLRQGFRCINSLNSRHKISSEVRDIKESLREIKDRGLSYGLRPFEQGGPSSSVEDEIDLLRIGSLFVGDDELVGIDSLSRELMGSLVGGRSTRTVISFLGEGGIGKTTLARKVYNDVIEKGSFDHHVWVTVSQSYNIHKIFKILVNEICPIGRDFITIEEAIELLRNSLQEKRYMIVFDDGWQTDLWNLFVHALPNNGYGCRILVTTRNSTVVDSFRQISSDTIVHELRSWSPEQSWELFCKKAFSCSGNESSRCPRELDQLSNEIVSKCQGLPLAIVAVAGLLSRKEKSKAEWQRVLDNLNHEFEENCGLSNVTKVLLLSYHDLPYHLKSCFLYFGIFPEDFSILGDRLYRLWIAEGFVKPRRDKTLEQVAEEYLNELINRNVVLFELRYGSDRYCSVHDLIREVTLTIINGFYFCQIFDENSSNFEGRSRRLSIHGNADNVLKAIVDSKFRSVVLFNVEELTSTFAICLFRNCKLLRLLDFNGAPLGNLPKEVGNLFHLKYLNLSGTKVKTLPKSIGKLRSLQTLYVSHTLVRELPVEINKLGKLRHLFANSFDNEAEYSVGSFVGMKMHEGIGRLEELQTLTGVEAHSGKVSVAKELHKLRKLQCLQILKVSSHMAKVVIDSIEKMDNLTELSLNSINQNEILDLDFISSRPPLLRYLQLNCQLRRFPQWISSLLDLQGLELSFSRLKDEPLKCLKILPKLSFLRLHGAYEGEELCFEKGGFARLEQLQLMNLEKVKAVRIERGALPLVEELDIGPFPLMKEMPSDVRHMSRLKSLRIYDMSKEFVRALQPDGGSEYMKIQHITNVTFGYNRGRGQSYSYYKLGSSELLQYLQVGLSIRTEELNEPTNQTEPAKQKPRTERTKPNSIKKLNRNVSGLVGFGS